MRNKNFYILAIIFLNAFLIGCDEVIILDIDQAQSKVVIDGLITTDDTTHYVKLSRTKYFYNEGSTERITSAVVEVVDNLGNVYSFTHNPKNDKGLKGYYLSDNTFAGVAGRIYTLTVQIEGVSYIGQDELMPVTTIDSLTWEFDSDAYEYYLEEIDEALQAIVNAHLNGDSLLIARAELYLEKVDGYYAVFFNAIEPQDRIDYYLWKFFRNGKVSRDFDTDIYIAEDEFVGEEIDHLEIPNYYSIGDTVTTEMYSLSRIAFVYYSDLSIVLNNDGGMFSPIPANPRNNLSNGALGYFQTSAVDRETIILTE